MNCRKVLSIRLRKPWCLIASAALLLTGLPHQSSAVTWLNTLAEAKKEAEEKDFPIAVFWSDGSPNVATGGENLSSKFVWLKLEKTTDATTLRAIGVDDYFTFGKMRSNEPGKNHNISGYVFMNAKGDIYSRLPRVSDRGIDGMLTAVCRRHYGPEDFYGSGLSDGRSESLPGKIDILTPPKELHSWKNCAKCTAFIEKAMPYIADHYPGNWYGGMLGSWTCGPALMMYGKHDALLKGQYVERARSYHDQSSTTFGGYHNWFRAGNAMSLSEYSLRYGLTSEARTILEDSHQNAVEYIDECLSWFHHPRKGGKNYSREQGMIGCLFHAGFVEMESMGIIAEPGLSLSRAANGRGGYGAAGGPGKNGILVAGLYASGWADDRFTQQWAQWQWGGKEPSQPHNPNGRISPQWNHAYANWHWMGTAVGLHRMGPAHYNDWAKEWCHALIELQLPDGSIPQLQNDTGAGAGDDDPMNYIAHVQSKNKKDDGSQKGGNWEATGVVASMVLMTEPGAFYGVPIKPKGSLPNEEAFKQGNVLFKQKSYAKAYANYAVVLPPGDSLELVPSARVRLRMCAEMLCPDREERRKRAAKLAKLPAETRAKAAIGLYAKAAKVPVIHAKRVPPPPPRAPKEGSVAKIDKQLVAKIADLADKGNLPMQHLKLSISRAKLMLKGANSAASTIALGTAATVKDLKVSDLSCRDRAKIAALLNAREPDNKALTGATAFYLECAGRRDLAAPFYQKAGEKMTQKFSALFK